MIVQWVNKWNLGLFNKNLNIKYFSININNNLDNKDLRFNNTIDCFDKLKAHLDFGLSIYRLFTIYGA